MHMSSTTYENAKKAKNEHKSPPKAMVYGAAVIAALGIAGGMKVHEANKDAKAAAEFNIANQPHNVVKFGANMTPYMLASEAVNSGYLDMSINEARDFITRQLETQMQERGDLKPDQSIDVGALAPNTPMEVPASWKGIGQPEDEENVHVSIGTAISAEVSPETGGHTVVKETDQSGKTTTTVEP